MIITENLTKRYTTDEVETTALDQISLSIDDGEFVAIMGPSGCGKSTLLNVLGLLDSVNSGSYRLMGKEVAGLSEKERSQLRKQAIGFIFQSFNLIDELNVFENIELPMQYQGIATQDRKSKVDGLLDRFGIAHRSKHFPQQLSGGQQQRVAICRAIAGNQRLIFADEPTGNLDSQNGKEVMKLLADLNASGTTIVMVTHSEHDAMYAQRVIRLMDGRVVG
jgi:putative ABC transport system ATP-binding protein